MIDLSGYKLGAKSTLHVCKFIYTWVDYSSLEALISDATSEIVLPGWEIMTSNDNTLNRWANVDMKKRRLSRPSGWLALTRDQGTQLLIEALIDGGDREFNKTELADYAGVSRPTVDKHLKHLLRLEVIEEVPNTSPARYQFNAESDVSQAILKVNGAVLRNEETLIYE